jgi:alkylation response protein AidB-like acyl-CoA dehydrogenase
MDFELSEEQELLRRGLRELLERQCDIKRVREVVSADGPGCDYELGSALIEAGWTKITVPESAGGAGLRFEDLVVVLEECGRYVVPLPLTTSLIGARLLDRASGGAHPMLKDETGPSTTFALGGEVSAKSSGDGWTLDGRASFVPYGTLATTAVVEANVSGSRTLFVVESEAAGVAWRELDVMDRTTRQYELSLDGAQGHLLFEGDCSDEIERLTDEWRAALAAETLGACQRMLEMTVAYAKEREQFGRPIGSNQAVKARIAEMAAQCERMRAAVYHAAVKIDAAAPDRSVAVAMAKAATAAPGTWVGSQAIHVHGGIGYTWEHDLHFYFKRVKSNELLLGGEMESLDRIADTVL